MKRFLKIGSVRSVIAILVILCAMALADAATRDLERVRIGYSVGGLIPFPLIVAKENRFFEQAGLDVELINIPPTIAVTALISGDIQYVIFAGTTLNAAVRGLPVKLVMVYNDRPLFSLMSKPDIRSIKELKGKVLGVATLTSGESFLSRRLLKDAGIDVEKEITLRVIGNTPDRLRALAAGAPRSDQEMIAVTFRGMAHARAQRNDSIALIMSRWKLERDVAEKAFDSTIKTWSETAMASDQALQAGIDESLKVSNSKQTVPSSRVANFTLVREVYREIKAK